MIKASSLTINNIKNNKFIQALPELYQLKLTVENNSWHNNDAVFDHTIRVMENLSFLLKKISITNKILQIALQQKINIHSRQQILLIATLFHDIAKRETIKIPDEYTECPNHEKIGAKKVLEILERFNLSKNEITIIARIIKYHGDIHSLISSKNKNIKRDFKKFLVDFADISLELILLAFADTLNSYLKQSYPKEYYFRIFFYEKFINKYSNK